VARGEKLGRPRLLSYFVNGAGGLLGHTILIYSSTDSTVAVDPAFGARPVPLRDVTGSDPIALARAVRGRDVVKARVLEIPELRSA
jgi:hypothetical protein